MRGPASGGPGARTTRSAKPRLDDVDLKILSQLVQDARISQRALARNIGMSAPAVADRITRLENAGVIRGYRAQLDYTLLDRPMTVVIQVLSDRSTTQLELAEKLAAFPEVERIDVITGPTDLEVRLRVRDPEHLNEVLFGRLMTASSEIQRTETHIALVTFEPPDFALRLIQSLAEDLSESRDQAKPGSTDQPVRKPARMTNQVPI
jgi:Lrp/AsnC family leucine-responsive transcriptional regulator